MSQRRAVEADTDLTPRAWVRLHESPFAGEWVGLTPDWCRRLPCSREELAWVRLWICLRAPAESRLSSQLLDQLWAEVVDED